MLYGSQKVSAPLSRDEPFGQDEATPRSPREPPRCSSLTTTPYHNSKTSPKPSPRSEPGDGSKPSSWPSKAAPHRTSPRRSDAPSAPSRTGWPSTTEGESRPSTSDPGADARPGSTRRIIPA